MPDYRAALGRGGDSMMAHMTPGEAVIPAGSMTPRLWEAFQEALDRQGMAPEQYIVGSGQNSINPATGQPEFLSGRDVVSEIHASPRSREEVERRSGDTMMGRESRDPVVRRLPPMPTSPELGGGAARGSQQGMIELVPQEDWAINPATGRFGAAGTLDAGAVLGGLAGAIAGPFGMAAGARFGSGKLDVPTFTEYDPYGPVGYENRRIRERRESEGKEGISRQRAIAETSFMRPAGIPPPEFLGLSSAMSPLQMRSAIASRAVAGRGGEYASPEAQSFYDNLLQRSLIGEGGELFGLDTLLPIDLQYLAQIRGIESPADTSALLAALQQ